MDELPSCDSGSPRVSRVPHVRVHHVRARGEVPTGFQPAARWIAVAGGCGYSPIAPGTVGSLLAVGLFLLVPIFGPSVGGPRWGVLAAYGLVVIGLFAAGCWAAGCAERQFGQHDDNRIVIDEVVGQLIALSPLVWLPDATPLFSFSLMVVTGFVLFRLFDVWKPGAIRWAEHRFEGGLGVMADDMLAGIHAASVLAILMSFSMAE